MPDRHNMLSHGMYRFAVSRVVVAVCTEAFREELSRGHPSKVVLCPRGKKGVERQCDAPGLRDVAERVLPLECWCAAGRPCPVRAYLVDTDRF
jgi:hypothetical protein